MKDFKDIKIAGVIKKNIDTLFMGMKETETVKMFVNTYPALRVSYFNELDTYVKVKGLDTTAIIRLRRLLPVKGHQAATC